MSLAASVLTAALALPQPGLVVAYDFARTNFANWSEDLTQGAWIKTGVNVQVMTGQHPEGLPMYAVVETTVNADHRLDQSFPSTPGGLWFAEVDMKRYGRDVVSFGFGTGSAWGAGLPVFSINFSTGQVSNLFPSAQDSGVSARHIGNGVYRVKFAARQGAAPSGVPTVRCWAGTSAATTGDGVSGVLLTRVKLSFGADSEYERTTDGQLLLDRSVRLWPAPAARTNFLIWTEDFTQSAWTKAGLTPSDPAQTDPLTGAKATRMTVTTMDPYLTQVVQGNPSGLTVTYTARVKMEGSIVGRQFRLYSYGASSTEALAPSGHFTATGDWQTISFTRTFPAGMASTAHVWRIDLPENGQVVGDTVLIAAPVMNFGTAALPYERQTDGVTYDLSLRGMRNLITNSELVRTSDTVAPTGWSVQLPTGVSASWSYGVAASGVPYAQVTLTGAVSTAGAAFNIYMTPTQTSAVPVTPGGTYTMSVNATQVSGPPLALQAGTHFWNTTGAYTGGAGGATGTSGLGAEPTQAVGTVNIPSTVQYATPRLGAFLSWPVESSQTRVYRISQPQFEMGAATTYQRSPNHATLGSSSGADANDPAWTAQGLSFDGVDDFINPTLPEFTGDFSLIAVCRGSSNFVVTRLNYASNNNTPGGTDLGWGLSMNGDGVGQFAWNTQASPTGAQYLSASGTPGQFNAFTVTSRAGRLAMFANGALKQENLAPLATAATGKPLYIGRRVPGNYFTGTIAFVAIYNRALSDAEVAQAYRFIRAQLSRRGVSI